MPNKRDLKLDEYNISKYAYRELANFCLQYPEKKRKIADLHNPLKAQQYSDMPHGTGVGEPTAVAAERAASLSIDCELIEQTAIEALPDEPEIILNAVTDEAYSFKPTETTKWSDFLEGRRYFFYRLYQKKIDMSFVKRYT